jgi:hypothetical protein
VEQEASDLGDSVQVVFDLEVFDLEAQVFDLDT